MDNPFRIEVYDKTRTLRGIIGAPKFATATIRFMATGLFQFALPAEHHLIPQLLEDGSRVAVRMIDSGDFVISGWVTGYRGEGPEMAATFTFDVIDDFAILRDTLGWVVPGSPITAQGTAGTNWTAEGPAETVLKSAFVANAVNRLGLSHYSVPASAGRGATVKARLRFQSLYDRLILVEDGAGIINSGIGVRFRQDGSTIVMDVWTPTTHPKPLTEESGIVREWAFSHDRATVARVVVGGQGEGQLRLFREKVDTAVQASTGRRPEVFRDGRDSNDPNVLYERADETLAEGAAKSGLSITLAETANFAYGKMFKIGDVVTIDVGGVQLTERLEEVVLSWTEGEGFEARPRIGEKDGSADAYLARIIGRIARAIRNRNTEI